MLDLYRIIREERIKKEWSQQHLAELVGYKGKSMIAQIEKGNVDLPSTMITKFAEVFGVTESYLMGWETPSEEKFLFTDELLQLDTLFKQLTPDHRKEVFRYMEYLLSTQNDESKQ